MRRGIVILLLFLLVVGGILGVSQLLRQQPPFEITIAVDPLGAAWVRSAAEAFNAGETLVGTRRVQVTIQEISDIDVWRGESEWRAGSHPEGWIASSSVSLDYAATLPLETVEASLARTMLVWGGFGSRVDVLTQDGAQAFDWEALAAAAASEGGAWATLAGGQASWGFLKFAFQTPERAMSGVAVLFSGAAQFSATTTLNGLETNSRDFRAWLLPAVQAVPNFQTLGADPAATIASRGTSVVDIALLPESEWLISIQPLASQDFRFSYPAYQFVFDFPLARWEGDETTDDVRAALAAFGNFLLSEAQQNNAMNFGLRPAAADPSGTERLFAAGAAGGILPAPLLDNVVHAPSRTDALSLIQWFIQSR
ncbi:MAG: substrate-binding domain-containing protein [Chloroflexi bacterium]|nr:substrate-binding domain-containing protein [Chloroflexota bacterium]